VRPSDTIVPLYQYKRRHFPNNGRSEWINWNSGFILRGPNQNVIKLHSFAESIIQTIPFPEFNKLVTFFRYLITSQALDSHYSKCSEKHETTTPIFHHQCKTKKMRPNKRCKISGVIRFLCWLFTIDCELLYPIWLSCSHFKICSVGWDIAGGWITGTLNTARQVLSYETIMLHVIMRKYAAEFTA
jgi:hypothetical protein